MIRDHHGMKQTHRLPIHQKEMIQKKYTVQHNSITLKIPLNNQLKKRDSLEEFFKKLEISLQHYLKVEGQGHYPLYSN